MTTYAIGIDSGTQSTKTLLVDGQSGRVLASHAVQYGLLPASAPGQKEQHPSTWVEAAAAGIDRVVSDSRIDPRDVTAIGISGQQHGLVALDEHDRVIRPAKLWCDTTTAAECETITSRLGGPEAVIALTGNTIPPGFTASKILWLKDHEPENFARLTTVLLPHDYLAFWLTGRKTMEHGDASGTGLMDIRSRAWKRDVLDAIDSRLEARLPPLADSRVPAGTVRPELAGRWGFSPEVVVSGSGDNMMGAIGTGSVREGIVTASLGTSGTIYACSYTPVVDPRGEAAAFCDATGRWLPLVCTMNVTAATEMVRRRFDLDHEAFARAAASVAPGSDGLLLVPFFEGERTPNCPDGTGVFVGIRERTFDAAHMARAAMEGVTIGMNYGLRRLRELGIVPREIRLTGGGSKSPVWRQIAAGVFGCPIVCLAGEEAAAYGAALHGFWVSELVRGRQVAIEGLVDRFVEVDGSTRVDPDKDHAGIYAELQGLFERLADDLRPAFAAHRHVLSRTS